MDNITVKKNQIYTAQITSFGSQGEGICRIDGFTVFVYGGVVGDVCVLKIVKVNKSFAFGKILEIKEPSPHRTEPACKVSGSCGGCQLMHISYDFQLKMKKQTVIDALERIGGFSGIEVGDVLGMQNPYNYRNKMQFPISRGEDGGAVCGFFKERTHEVIPVDECITGPDECTSIIAALKEYMRFTNTPAYNEKDHSGILRHLFIRKTSKDLMVAVVATKSIKTPELLVKLILQAQPATASVLLNINDKKTNLILGDKYITLYGKETVCDTLGGYLFEISAESFYQINHDQTEILYKTAVDFAGLTGCETVFDLYCGAGTISIFMAERAKKVIGIEIVEKAVENAKRNAENNGLENLHFYAGDAGKLTDYLYSAGEKADVVVFDPPRKGADELTLNTILKMAPEKIVYVSCNPATLARDLKYLAENGGYKVKKVQPVDMFPHTHHVETVVLLQRQNT